jgi:hypothetical protein
MFKVIDLCDDELVVEKYKLGLKFTAFETSFELDERETMELKGWLNQRVIDTCTTTDLDFEYHSGELGIYDSHGGLYFDILLCRDDVINFINWVNENV